IYEGVLFYIMKGIKPNYAELGRQYNCDPRTVKKYYEAGKENELERLKKRQQNKKASKLDPFKGIINKTLKQLSRIELLIIDEIGYTPITKEQADLFYQLMSLRYEWKSTIITTNIPFSSWGESFSNKIVSAAIIDRLVHHSKVFKITGESYRLKDYKTEKSLNIRQS
ncbi:TPA: ATP-binding protein, partial [Staphylococcus aureus]